MRDPKAVTCALVMSLMWMTLGAGGASALCRACDPFLHCMEQTPGARLCIESPGVCSMVLPCVLTGGSRAADGADEGLLTLSLSEATDVVAPALEPGAGPLAVGAGAHGAGAARGRLVAALLAHGRDYAVWFADAADGGFAVKRAESGGAVHVEVLEMTGGAPGRVLATALLLPQDRLRVPVMVAGRERVLLLQAAVVAPGVLVAEQARLRRALQEAGREIGNLGEPLLEPRPF